MMQLLNDAGKPGCSVKSRMRSVGAQPNMRYGNVVSGLSVDESM